MVMLNSYSAEYIYNEDYSSANLVGWTYDQQTSASYYNIDSVVIGDPTQSEWLHIVPWGINKVLTWIQNRYSYNGCGTGIGINKNGKLVKIPLMITEQGMDILGQTQDTSYQVAKNDTQRIEYYSSYLTNVGEAVTSCGIDFKGYFPWALMDNFEWTNAYTCRFGLFYVQCNQYNTIIPRLPKNSVYWYKNFITNNPNGPKSSTNVNSSCTIYNPDSTANFPWSGGQIRGYYYFSSNAYTTTPSTDFYSLNNLTSTQNNYNPQSIIGRIE